MEQGIAKIIFGAGRIATASPPKPVAFDPHSFSGIYDGAPVLFQRSAPGSDWASLVVLASQHTELVALATPAAGLASDAATEVEATAARLLAEVQFAPGPAQAKRHLKHARDRMERIGTSFAECAAVVDLASIAPLL